MKKSKVFIFICLFNICFIFNHAFSLSYNIEAKVTKVYDGDTLTVNIPGKNSLGLTGIYKVRIKGLDCFERDSSMAEKQVQRQMKRFFISQQEVYNRGDKARDFLTQLLIQSNNAATLKVESRDTKDKYERVLAEIWVRHKNIYKSMIQSGYCFKYIPPKKYKK